MACLDRKHNIFDQRNRIYQKGAIDLISSEQTKLKLDFINLKY